MSLEENWENLFHGLKKERLDTRREVKNLLREMVLFSTPNFFSKDN